MSRVPVRLLEQGSLSEHERALLESAQSSAPVEYDVDEGAARFRGALTALTAASAAAAAVHGIEANGAGAAASKAMLVKLVAKLLLGVFMGAAVAGGGLVTGVLLARHHNSVKTATVQIVAPEGSGPALAAPLGSLSVESSAALAIPTEPMAKGPEAASRTKHPAMGRGRGDLSHLSAESAATAGIAREVEGASDSVRTSTPPAAEKGQLQQAPPQTAQPQPDPPAAIDHPLSEVAAIALAKDLVERDPKAALKVLDNLRRNHPRGYFVEERQALTVLALAGAGQTDAAQQEARAFLRVFPNGPFSDRVRAVAH